MINRIFLFRLRSNGSNGNDDHENVRTFKRRYYIKRRWIEKVADRITHFSGSFIFLIMNVVWFAVWIVLNLNIIPNVEPFDPYPFGLLTLIVSLEAIILTIILLISQNRETSVNDLRSEIDANIDIITESKVSKVLEVLQILAEKNGIDLANDEDFLNMYSLLTKIS